MEKRRASKIFEGKPLSACRRSRSRKMPIPSATTQRSKHLYVVNGGKDAGETDSRVSVIDTTEGKKLADIRIEGETLWRQWRLTFSGHASTSTTARGMRWP